LRAHRRCGRLRLPYEPPSGRMIAAGILKVVALLVKKNFALSHQQAKSAVRAQFEGHPWREKV